MLAEALFNDAVLLSRNAAAGLLTRTFTRAWQGCIMWFKMLSSFLYFFYGVSSYLKLILSLHHQRKLSKNLTIQFRNTEYQLQGYGQGYRLRGATITVCEDFNGSVYCTKAKYWLTGHYAKERQPL